VRCGKGHRGLNLDNTKRKRKILKGKEHVFERL
jgi:hypothetical protein